MRKQEEAMKILEALSGVDEELLARCEAADLTSAGAEKANAGLQAAGAGMDIADAGMKAAGAKEGAARRTERKNGQNVYRWRYLSRCAAVLALVAVGAVSWRGFQIFKDTAANESLSGGSPQAHVIDFGFNLELEDGGTVEGSDEDGITGDAADDGRLSEDMVTMENKITEKDMQEGDLPMPAAVSAGANGAGGTEDLDKANAPEGTDGLDGANVSGGTDSLRDANGMDCASYTENVKLQGCPVSPAERLTAEEALQVECLGDYVPTALPAGYAFESAQYETETGCLMICWTRGLDNIMLSFRQVDSAAVETADVQRPETYDERLYEIPFGDVVPEEYRQVFFAPVFAKDDFSLEIVRSRVLSYSGDSGDTSTPRGNFSVLYDGVLVRFNGRGTPEEIWEMFASIS